MGLLEGGCQVPIGVHADVDGDKIHVEAIIASLDGSKILRDHIDGTAEDAVILGQKIRQQNACCWRPGNFGCNSLRRVT